MSLLIQGNDLTWRTPEISDAHAFVNLFSNPLNTEKDANKSKEAPTIESRTTAILEWKSDAAQGKGYQMVIEKDGEIIGCGGVNQFYPENDNKVVDVGILIDSSHWRKGYATMALEVLFEYVFETGNDIVELWTMQYNEPLRKMLEKSFDMKGISARGPFGNDCQVRLTKEEWTKRSNTNPISIRYQLVKE